MARGKRSSSSAAAVRETQAELRSVEAQMIELEATQREMVELRTHANVDGQRVIDSAMRTLRNELSDLRDERARLTRVLVGDAALRRLERDIHGAVGNAHSTDEA